MKKESEIHHSLWKTPLFVIIYQHKHSFLSRTLLKPSLPFHLLTRQLHSFQRKISSAFNSRGANSVSKLNNLITLSTTQGDVRLNSKIARFIYFLNINDYRGKRIVQYQYHCARKIFYIRFLGIKYALTKNRFLYLVEMIAYQVLDNERTFT